MDVPILLEAEDAWLTLPPPPSGAIGWMLYGTDRPWGFVPADAPIVADQEHSRSN